MSICWSINPSVYNGDGFSGSSSVHPSSIFTLVCLFDYRGKIPSSLVELIRSHTYIDVVSFDLPFVVFFSGDQEHPRLPRHDRVVLSESSVFTWFLQFSDSLSAEQSVWSFSSSNRNAVVLPFAQRCDSFCESFECVYNDIRHSRSVQIRWVPTYICMRLWKKEISCLEKACDFVFIILSSNVFAAIKHFSSPFRHTTDLSSALIWLFPRRFGTFRSISLWSLSIAYTLHTHLSLFVSHPIVFILYWHLFSSL